MAKRDILARAMSVSPLQTSPETKPGGEAADVPGDPSAQAKAKTAPGVMMNFMVERSTVHRELEDAKAKLQEFEGASVARKVDPVKIKASSWANRSDQSFLSAQYAALKEEILKAGGNVQPIKVRRLAKPEQGAEFEIVFGHRRHRACLELGIPVLAIIVDSMEDLELYAEMDRENRNRVDLSAWEQGRSYARALEAGLYPSMRKLAEALDLQVGNVSASISIGQLPEVVVAAFSSPIDIQFRWAAPLRDAQQRDPDGLIAKAKTIAELPRRPTAGEVFKRLVAKTDAPAIPAGKEWIDVNGKATARIVVDSKGRAKLSFLKPLTDQQYKDLVDAVEKLLG
ncbi:MAG: ParB/RepB/Spo0J family partition protein [Proteobacteria bacterium]|nr:ParB/RepB/Spo0J family partition protein [Pseudomonadota bacterium]